MTIDYEETKEFKGDVKKLRKRFRSIEQDIELAKRTTVELWHVHRLNNNSIMLMTGFCSEQIKVCKVKKFACKALKGRGVQSGIRLIYAFFPDTMRVVLLELYYKGDKELEDANRIREFLETHNDK